MCFNHIVCLISLNVLFFSFHLSCQVIQRFNAYIAVFDLVFPAQYSFAIWYSMSLLVKRKIMLRENICTAPTR